MTPEEFERLADRIKAIPSEPLPTGGMLLPGEGRPVPDYRENQIRSLMDNLATARASSDSALRCLNDLVQAHDEVLAEQRVGIPFQSTLDRLDKAWNAARAMVRG